MDNIDILIKFIRKPAHTCVSIPCITCPLHRPGYQCDELYDELPNKAKKILEGLDPILYMDKLL